MNDPMRKTQFFNLFTLITLILFIPSELIYQTKLRKDREAILKMCGCFEIEFNFAETFNFSENRITYHLKFINLMLWNWHCLLLTKKTRFLFNIFL